MQNYRNTYLNFSIQIYTPTHIYIRRPIYVRDTHQAVRKICHSHNEAVDVGYA